MDPILLITVGVVTLVIIVFVLLQVVGRLLRKVGPTRL